MSRAPAPNRVLFVRPDTYGDLVIFEPVLRAVRAAWPEAKVAVLVRESYVDIAPLMPAGVHWLTTRCQPYRHLPTDPVEAEPLADLRRTVAEFAPDLVVAAASSPTWLEFAVASAAPEGSARVRLGSQALDPRAAHALRELSIPAEESFRPVEVPATEPEGKKNAALAAALLGGVAELPSPQASVPDDALAKAREFLSAAGLKEGEFLAVAPAGTRNVPIKAWPSECFGAVVGWAETEHALPALLVGAREEKATLEEARAAAAAHGAQATVIYAGNPGEIARLAALLSLSRAFIGNDTGALHLAAATGRPAVGVYGGGTWPRFLPEARAPFAAVVQPLPCFDCGWDCIFGDAPCLRLIEAKPVRAALSSVLAGESPGIIATQELDAMTHERIAAVVRRVRDLTADGLQRLRQVEELTEALRAAEADRAARGAQVEVLTASVKGQAEEFAQRGEQIVALTKALQAAEADRAARGAQVETLTALAHTKSEESLARERQIQELTGLVSAREAEFSARGAQIETLTGLLQTAEADRAARGAQIEELTALAIERHAGISDVQTAHEETRERLEAARRQEDWLRGENRRLHAELHLARRVVRGLIDEPAAQKPAAADPARPSVGPWLRQLWRKIRS